MRSSPSEPETADTGFEGVTYEADQMAYRARIEGDGGLIYEDYFADPEFAAFVRELAVIVKGVAAPRNFSCFDRRDLCSRILALLGEYEQIGLPGTFSWLEKVGMSESELLNAAAAQRHPEES